MASDTCITTGDGSEPFGGIKVLAVPIRIKGPVDAETGGYEMLYEKTAGLCFSGSFLTAYLIKETISEVLSNLQAVVPPHEISFERIARVAFKLYSHLCSRLGVTLQYGFDADFILSGLCPLQNRTLAYKFALNEDGKPEIAEVLKGGDHAFQAIGAGSDRFEKLYTADLAQGDVRVHFQIMRRILDVIDDKSIPSVDGTIQYGEFNEDKDFTLFGLIHPPADPKAEPLGKKYIRGTDIDATEAEDDPDGLGLYIKYSYKDPFEILSPSRLASPLNRIVEHRVPNS